MGFTTKKVFEAKDMDGYIFDCWVESWTVTGNIIVDEWTVTKENKSRVQNHVNEWLIENGAEVGDNVLILNYR